MTQTAVGVLFVSLWIGAMLLWSGANQTDVRSYEHTKNPPCEFMSGGTWSSC